MPILHSISNRNSEFAPWDGKHAKHSFSLFTFRTFPWCWKRKGARNEYKTICNQWHEQTLWRSPNMRPFLQCLWLPHWLFLDIYLLGRWNLFQESWCVWHDEGLVCRTATEYQTDLGRYGANGGRTYSAVHNSSAYSTGNCSQLHLLLRYIQTVGPLQEKMKHRNKKAQWDSIRKRRKK
jgi:hypothetical protein